MLSTLHKFVHIFSVFKSLRELLVLYFIILGDDSLMKLEIKDPKSL